MEYYLITNKVELKELLSGLSMEKIIPLWNELLSKLECTWREEAEEKGWVIVKSKIVKSDVFAEYYNLTVKNPSGGLKKKLSKIDEPSIICFNE